MKFENTEVWGFEHALRGMRNPKESWDRSDSHYGCWEYGTYECDCDGCGKGIDRADNCTNYNKYYIIGENDLKLAQHLIKAGSEHRKFMRQIFVSVDITAPLYWWKEFDTYKVGTVANSTSTMHKLATTPITIDCFEIDDYDDSLYVKDSDQTGTSENFENYFHVGMMTEVLIDRLEQIRLQYLETKDKRYWKELIRWLPESWLQKRTVTMNYENIYNMVHQRTHHKLNEWSGIDNPDAPNFISWARSLPYAKELIFLDESEGNSNASSCDK